MNTTVAPVADSATIAALWVYPIKSCAGIALSEALFAPEGIDLDRAWMVVDESGEFVSQRDYPRMALIQPSLRHNDVVLRAPGMLALHLSIEAVEQPTRVRVWDDTVDAFDMGAVASQWFTDFLTQGRERLRLVRFDPDFGRVCDQRWTREWVTTTQFADGFAYLVMTEASMAELVRHSEGEAWSAEPATQLLRRFRPNIVLAGLDAHAEDHLAEISCGSGALRLVKPCARCQIPEIDPSTGQPGVGVTRALRAYRADARVGGALTMGMNGVFLRGDGTPWRVGDVVSLTYAF